MHGRVAELGAFDVELTLNALPLDADGSLVGVAVGSGVGDVGGAVTRHPHTNLSALLHVAVSP